MNGKEQKNNDLLLPGPKAVLELLENSPGQLEHVFLRKDKNSGLCAKITDLCRANGVRFTLLEKAALDRMFAGNHQGVLGRINVVPSTSLQTLLSMAPHCPLPLILALDQIQDPGNAGALARTLYALGGAGIILPKHNTTYLGAAALKASAGALPLLTVCRVPNLKDALQEAASTNFTLYSAQSQSENLAATNLFEVRLNLPAVLVLGNEQKGIRPGVLRAEPTPLYIPFGRKFDSLNVAQAGAIFMAAFAAGNRQS